MRLTMSIILLLLLPVSEATVTATGPTRTISSTTDTHGNIIPGSAAISGTATVTCVSAHGNNPHVNRPACNIAAPGYNGAVKPGSSVGTSGAGTVTLTCSGAAPLQCSASIRQ